jgi:hypothetical protein
MPRQRDKGRRWALGWPARRRKAIGTVPLLDSISLTAFMTDPAEPELPPVSRTGSDVLSELPSWEEQQAALPTAGAWPDQPALGPSLGTVTPRPVPGAEVPAEKLSAAPLLESWSSAAAAAGETGEAGTAAANGDAPASGPLNDAEPRAPEPLDATDLLAVVQMPQEESAWEGSALDLLDALDHADEPSPPPARPGAVDLLDAIVGPVGAGGWVIRGGGGGGGGDDDDPVAPDAGPAYLPIPESSSTVVVPDEVIAAAPSDPPREEPPSLTPADPEGSGARRGKCARRIRGASIITGLGAVLLVGGCLVAGGVIPAHSAPVSAPSAQRAHHRADEPVVTRLLGGNAAALDLPLATTTPAPAPPSVAAAATAPHEVFGYAPYWSLPSQSSFPVRDFSTLAYFAVDVNPDGTVQESGPGWEGYRSQALVDLVSRAHAAGDRVVLTAADFDQSSLDAMTHDPNAGRVLGENLLALVRAKHLDGVNLDFEGNGSADQAGLDRLVAAVGDALRAADPDYQLTMATYASSAGDPDGFYDIRGLARSVDGFFVMAYDVDLGPAAGPSAGSGPYSDATYVKQYVSAVGASKVILGLPLFGYAVPTTGPALGDAVTGPAQPVTDAQAVASGPTYWDAASNTAWTSYRAGGHWHQVFFDNANMLSLKEQLAVRSGVLGVGAWALGMEGSNDSLLTVLDGATPAGLPPIGPSAPPGSGGSAQGSGGTRTTRPPATPSPSGGGSARGGGGAAHRHRGSSGGPGSTTTTTTRPKKTPTTTTTTTRPKKTPTTTTTTSTTTTTTTTTTAGRDSHAASGTT